MLESYLPRIHRVVRRHVQSWCSRSELWLFPAVEGLSFDVLALLLLGVNVERGRSGTQWTSHHREE